MPFAAAAVAAAGIGAIASSSAASTQASAARDAANIQAGASENASQTQLQMFHEAQSTLAPYVTTGNNALAQLSKLYGVGGANGTTGQSTPDTAAMEQALQNFPGYQFAFNQGQQALDRSAASRGLLLSGGQIKDSQTFGQGMASQQFGGYVNQLQALSSLGESGASMTGNAAITTGQGIAGSQIAGGNAIAQGILGAGQATASGIVGGANAATGAINTGVSNSILSNFLNPAANPSNNASSFTGFNSGNAQNGGVLAGGVPLQGNIPVGSGGGGF